MSGGMDRDPYDKRVEYSPPLNPKQMEEAAEKLRKLLESKPDSVNHPAHYTRGGIEVIDAIEAWGLTFKLANVIKYVARADHKGKPLEDLKKAQWYLNREIAQREAAEAKAKVSSGG